MEKKIIGLIGQPKFVKVISSNLEKRNFYKISIEDKIKEIASFLLSPEEIKKDTVIKKLREKAYKVHRSYWINLLLSSVSLDYEKIVIDDLMEEDVLKDTMIVYRVNENNFEEVQREILSLP